MSTLEVINLGDQVHKDRSVSLGGFSLNGHDSSHIMSEKGSCASQRRKTTNMQSTDFHNSTGQKTTPVLLFGECIVCHYKLSLAISLLKFRTAFFFFSSTTLYEFWFAQLFFSIVSYLAPSVSSSSLPSFSGHFSLRLPIFILAFLSVLLRMVSIHTCS
jgi:hypothetical protein